MDSTTSNSSQFMGNLTAQGYGGADGTANAAADVYGVGVSAIYTGLAIGAEEAGYLGGALPGRIGIIGTAVALTAGLAVAGTSCNALGALAGAVGGLAGAAAATPTGPIGQLIIGSATSLASQKAATALCDTLEGYVNGEAPASSAQPQAASNGSLSATATAALVAADASVSTTVSQAIPTVDPLTAAFLSTENQLLQQMTSAGLGTSLASSATTLTAATAPAAPAVTPATVTAPSAQSISSAALAALANSSATMNAATAYAAASTGDPATAALVSAQNQLVQQSLALSIQAMAGFGATTAGTSVPLQQTMTAATMLAPTH